jgi:hypothetical protein
MPTDGPEHRNGGVRNNYVLINVLKALRERSPEQPATFASCTDQYAEATAFSVWKPSIPIGMPPAEHRRSSETEAESLICCRRGISDG